MERKSSILNVGQARNKTRIEYLGEGGTMELRANQLQKRTIDCLSLDTLSICETQWYFAELCLDYVDVDSFENDDADVEDYRDILSWCASVMASSPSARLLLKEASEKDWKITAEDLRGSDYFIDVEEKLLILDNNALLPCALGKSEYFRNMMLVTMIKALRDIWQEKRHGGFDALYSPDHILLMERIRAADLDVIAVLVAWELRAEDYTDLWRHLIGSEIGDMAMCFSGYLERDPSAQFNGQALVSAYKQWFRCSKRIDSCDHDALEYMDDVLASYEAINPFGTKKPSKMNVEILSCLPDKTAYLQGLGTEILSNPVYSSVDNVINQTHLFHIMYDLQAVVVEDVPFRDADLARKIFPVE
ncbi:MAG: hypothetical protein COA45_06550 [Zetaproteobacteria bacterium]|nr:MAG: hypothetical protein COA45_06550 [Zetaproteobacteria bacterium]